MFGMFRPLKDAVRKRAAYRRIVAELSHMDGAMARDLGIHPTRIGEVAREAVYCK